MDAFQSPCASLSIFNRNTEIIQVEYGYGRTRIPRSESIASHVLLTNEVMAVLDTCNVCLVFRRLVEVPANYA